MSTNYLNIHMKINEKLEYFIKAQKIPNIIFHGPSGSGKRTIVNDFVKKIYNNCNDLKKKTYYVCRLWTWTRYKIY